MNELVTKFAHFKGEMTRWQLTQQEENWLLGGSGFTCGIGQIDPTTENAKKFEERLDAIESIASTLSTLHKDIAEDEVAQLRRTEDSPPFNGRSPLEFVRDGNEEGNQNIVQELASNLDFN